MISRGIDLFELLFGLSFVLFFGFFIYTFVSLIHRGRKQRRMDDASPRLSVPATVVTKRTEVGRHHHHNAGTHTSHTDYFTRYYATFQFESGDRLELAVDGRDFGFLVEGDRGTLQFQGSRFLGFSRG